VDTCPDVGVATINSHPNSRITSSGLLTHSMDTNEWVTLESKTPPQYNQKASKCSAPDYLTESPQW